MSDTTDATAVERRALEGMQEALRLVCVALPHLAGLAHAVRVGLEPRVPTAAITPSGRLLVNAGWFGQLDRGDATFVVAHELLHLALQTARRDGCSGHRLFNCAHDYIINDMLTEALGRPAPAGGLQWPGARWLSAEVLAQELLAEARTSGRDPAAPAWAASAAAPDTVMAEAMRAAGLAAPADAAARVLGDALTAEQERQWFPDTDPAGTAQARAAVERAAARAASLECLREGMERLAARHAGEAGDGPATAACSALRTLYRPPWELALQRWLDGVAPGPRTYLRPSRRGAERHDVALPGRRREGWQIHIVLDTSGSMSDELPRVLGVVGAFCEAVGVGEVRLVQCDNEVTRDERVPPEALQQYQIVGLGGSEMSPALRRLASDPAVEAAIVLTDGAIDYPDEPMPYDVVWVLTAPSDDFAPPYGHVISLPTS